MLKSAASRVAWVGKIAFMVFVLAAVFAGCSDDASNSGTKEADSATQAPPQAKNDYVTTTEGQKVLVRMVANDAGRNLQIDRFNPKGTKGDIICEADVESGLLRSCTYTPEKGFTGKDEFPYIVKDKDGKTDEAKVVVHVKPAN